MAGRQAGFWDIEHRLRELSAQGDPLEKLAATVDFEIFPRRSGGCARTRGSLRKAADPVSTRS